MKKVVLLAALLLIATASAAHSACTEKDIETKAQALTQQFQSYAQAHQAEFGKMMEEYQKDLQDLAKTPEDLDAGCKFFDKWIEKTK